MEKIALYGLGTETEKAIEQYEVGYEIVGLLDGFQESGEIYGKRILSLSQAADFGIEQIVVVARPGSCKAIAKRIGAFCREKEIALFDVRGKDLLEEKRIAFDLKGIAGGTREDLMKQIRQAEVVSFDLFDTLVMRRVLAYTDLFDLMGMRLFRGQDSEEEKISKFSALRLAAEKELSKQGAPRLTDIYGWVRKEASTGLFSQTGLGDKFADKLAVLEWELDQKTILPRQEMLAVFEEALQSGKRVYITTDTYYSRAQIEQILEKAGIKGYTDLFVSSVYGKGKTQGLFEVLRKAESGKRILHIGNDIISDIEAANASGLDAFQVYGAEELWDAVDGFALEQYAESVSDRVKLGLLAARIFESPFCFEEEERQLAIRSASDVGYGLCGPMILDFLFWFDERVRASKCSNVWFSARDGYLLTKLYPLIGEREGTYFLTSRIAAIRAGVENVSDIRYVESMKFFGTQQEQMKVRFGISGRPQEREMPAYEKQILQKAEIQRQNYGRYLAQLDLQEGTIAFFDFVAKGTTQMFVQRLTKQPIKGLYFLQLEPEFMKDKCLDIEPFYSKEETEQSAIFDLYYILETILTAPHPQVLEFDENGEPVYAEETRSRQEFCCFEEMQQGILDYFEDYLTLLPKEWNQENKGLDEKILKLIRGLQVTDPKFRSLRVEDPFFNRTTEVSDLLD